MDLRKRLGSSLSTQTKIDLNLTCYAFQPPTTSFDITVSCPLLPSYRAAATLSSSAIFDTRHAEKAAAHLHGLTAQGRAYHTLCLTTLNGIGPDPVFAYVDQVFLRSASRETAAGGSPHDAMHRRDICYASITASSVRATAVLLCRHVCAVPRNVSASGTATEMAQKSRLPARTAASRRALQLATAISLAADAASHAPPTNPAPPRTHGQTDADVKRNPPKRFLKKKY